ncbi:TPA: hypothetical protein DIV55_02870 [Patescibacteria group bacterium]|nr:hypothetical protein [Patescibacteria group bacterium]
MPSLSRTTELPNYLTTNSKVKRGFTLIELLVVIAIIGILASFAVASFTSAQAKGRDSRRKADLDAIRKALELYKTDSTGARYYPSGNGDAVVRRTGDPVGNTNVLTSGNYIKQIPYDPRTNSPYISNLGNIDGSACVGGCTTHRLRATLENANDPQAAGATFDKGSAITCPRNTEAWTTTPLTYGANEYIVCPP